MVICRQIEKLLEKTEEKKMKNYYINYPRNFANEYGLCWIDSTDTKSAEEAIERGWERITRKEAFRKVSREWSDASISCRALPLKSEELRQKLGLKSGGSSERHIFAYPGMEGRTMALTRRINDNQ